MNSKNFFSLIVLGFISFQNAQNFKPFEGPLSEVNKNFHADYEALVETTQTKIKSGKTPTILFTGGNLILYYQGNREVKEVISDLYHQYKAIGHISLGLFTAFENYQTDQLLSEEEIYFLKQDHQYIQKALEHLTQEKIPLEYLEIHRLILVISLKYLEIILEQKTLNEEITRAYSQSVSLLLLKGADLAAKLQIDLMHQSVSTWRQKISPEDWASLKVVLCGAHQPRTGYVARQYFERILHEKASEGAIGEDKILYAESLFSEDKAVNLLARHIIDQKAGLFFFNDRFRLQKDLLADGAEKYLNQLLMKQDQTYYKE
ncbi:MAG: hypothetical protein AABZ60_00380 [Planctomycetota bacterium]